MKMKPSASLWIAVGFLVLALGGAFDLVYTATVKHAPLGATQMIEPFVWLLMSVLFYVNSKPDKPNGIE